jgi:opacity protein-like surface antigen
MSRLIVCTLALLIGAPALAQQIEQPTGEAAELALSNDTLDARYLAKMDQGKDSRWVGGVFVGEERDLVLNAAMMFGVDLDRRFDIAFGPQLYAALLRDENEDVMALSLGGEVRFYFDPRRRFAVSGRAFYAPDILSFGSADNLTDLSARAEMQVSDRVMAFAGMRWFEFDLTDGSGERTLQEEVFVGLQYQL